MSGKRTNDVSVGVQLIVNDISPSPAALGTLNGVALSLQSGVRAIVPALFTVIFAFGVQKQILWGYLAWLAMILFALGFRLALHWLPERAEGRLPPEQPADSEAQADGQDGSDREE
jgi:hypothetical protein